VQYNGSMSDFLNKAIDAGWRALVAKFKDNPKTLLYGGATAMHFCVFWGYGLLLLGLDLTKSPHWLYKYKIQKDQSVTLDQVRRCVLRVLSNQFLFHVLPAILLARSVPLKVVLRTLSRPAPTWQIIFRDFIFFALCQELLFYLTHRLVHLPWFYRRVHKLHHEFKAPIGIAAEYAHPFEFLVSNVIPGIAGPLIMRSHILCSWLFLAWGMFLTVSHHSGYDFPWLGLASPRFHDFHHYSFTSNFGTFGLVDRILGTDTGFDEYSKAHPLPVSEKDN